MFRLLGFLIGSATSIVVILLITGIPEFHLDDPAIRQDRFDEAVEKLMAKRQEAEQATQKLTENLVQAAVAVQENIASADNEAIASAEPAEPVTEVAAAETYEDITKTETDIEFELPGDEAGPLTEMQWYSFWNPFRSKIAANGFVSQLELVTGLDYRVVKVKTGVYEVAFAYDDDDERRRKLSQISAATGLDLPES